LIVTCRVIMEILNITYVEEEEEEEEEGEEDTTKIL
jgi:hypothetical protein